MALPQILVDAERLFSEGKIDEAAVLYNQILMQNERHPYILAGMAQCFMKKPETLGIAIALFNYAWDRFKEDKQKSPYELPMNLGISYKYAHKWDKAKEWCKRAVDIEETAASLANYGVLFNETADVALGRKYLERAVKLDPSQSMAHWNLALCLMSTAHQEDNWSQAWVEHDLGAHNGGPRFKKNIDLPDWDGTPGKKVLAHGEQGIGDEIMFASMLLDLMRDCEVILDCHPRLVTLFEKSFGVKCYGTRKQQTELEWLAQEKPDAVIPLGSLGRFYRNNRSDFPGTPYLKADPAPKGDKFRIGISWTGGRLSERVAKRTVPLSWWDPILAMNGVEFVSLQYTDGAADEIAMVRSKYGHDVKDDPAARAEDYYETACLVKSCDLVISVCTSVIHLAGALGVPTWVMVPKHPAWRYQASGPMPWYRSVRLYRQPKAETGAWIPVIDRVAADLYDLLNKKEQKAA